MAAAAGGATLRKLLYSRPHMQTGATVGIGAETGRPRRVGANTRIQHCCNNVGSGPRLSYLPPARAAAMSRRTKGAPRPAAFQQEQARKVRSAEAV